MKNYWICVNCNNYIKIKSSAIDDNALVTYVCEICGYVNYNDNRKDYQEIYCDNHIFELKLDKIQIMEIFSNNEKINILNNINGLKIEVSNDGKTLKLFY